MKNIFVCAALTLAVPLSAHDIVPGGGHLALVATTFAVAAGSNFVQGFQMPCSSYDNGEVSCALGKDTLDEASHSLFKVRKDKQIVWQKNQERFLKRCNKSTRVVAPTQETLSFCPVDGESVTSYVERVTKSHALQSLPGERGMLSTDALFNEDFWDLPWSAKRFLLAVNIEVGLRGANDPLPVSNLTPLDHALKQKDHEMIFFLWERGAREAKHSENFKNMLLEMLRSSDERSVTMLKQMKPYGDPSLPSWNNDRELLWSNYEWARDLEPELVRKKMYVLLGASQNSQGQWRTAQCVPSLNRVPDSTPGLKAVKDVAKEISNWTNCVDCTIL